MRRRKAGHASKVMMRMPTSLRVGERPSGREGIEMGTHPFRFAAAVGTERRKGNAGKWGETFRYGSWSQRSFGRRCQRESGTHNTATRTTRISAARIFCAMPISSPGQCGFAGVKGVTFARIQVEGVEGLRQELLSKTYRPQPVRGEVNARSAFRLFGIGWSYGRQAANRS
ncbi:hypothetical protein A4R29_04920 [Mesorhizobium ciceri biovar biserrulae]|nr:hypothetical protein A4R29_04920 [Mesorhizobium ciceri biovar biserrulae]